VRYHFNRRGKSSIGTCCCRATSHYCYRGCARGSTRSAPAVQRAAPAAVPTIGALDTFLVIAAVVAGLFAAGTWFGCS